jgi:hypothetical protein
MINRLVVNGCSYIKCYDTGKGHIDLAEQLNIPSAYSLALPGSCNNRIIRTTLKDSYITNQSTLYIVGLSFLNRSELPVGHEKGIEGKWISFQNQINPDFIADFWTDQDSRQAVEHNLKIESHVIKDKLEDLMFKLLAMISDLNNRNHQIVIFRQPPDYYTNYLNENKFRFLKKCVNIVDGLSWGGLEFQAKQNIKYAADDKHLSKLIRHPLPGEHGPLNKFLVEYTHLHSLLA